MKLSDVRNMVLCKLASLFDGFMNRKSEDEGFARTIPGGRQEVLVSLLDYDPVFVFSLVMCVRLDAVENIFHLFSGAPPEYQATTPTSITQLQYFFPGHQGKKEYSASTEEDIEAAVRELSVIRQKILRFFDQHQDVKALDATMNSEEAADFDRSGQPYRAMHGVIVARLANNTRFEKIVARYRNEAQPWPDEDKDKLDRLVSYLKNG